MPCMVCSWSCCQHRGQHASRAGYSLDWQAAWSAHVHGLVWLVCILGWVVWSGLCGLICKLGTTAYKSISLKFCSHSDVVQIIHYRQNFIVLEIQNKQFSSHYPVVRPAAYVAGYMLKPSTNVMQLDNTLRLTLWNSFYYKRCLQFKMLV